MDIGTLVDGMTVVSISFDPPEVWLSCGNGHRVWATPAMLEGGVKIICAQCRTEAQARESLQERSRLADELLNSGNEYTDAYEALIASERDL